MISYCIKINNNNIKNYLLNTFENINISDVHYSCKKFKIYDNVIIHYKGNATEIFKNSLITILTDCICKFYESTFINQSINCEYFYFNEHEKKIIQKNCSGLIDSEKIIERNELIYIALLKYLSTHSSIILDGFANFRLFEYKNFLDTTLEIAVNKFIIDKEYLEFIDLLKLYINSKESEINLVNLIYTTNECIILDEEKNIISYPDNIFKAKYLSDISFSSNDYALNTLLTLLPKKIIIHLITEEDDFINTLKSIFDNKIYICTDCNICKTYNILNQSSFHK